MNTKYISKLEYSLVLEQLSDFCITNFGKELCSNLLPQNNKEIVLNLLNETSEAVTLFSKKKLPPIEALPDIGYSLKTLESSGILSIKALLELAKIFKMAFSLKEYFSNDLDNDTNIFPILEIYFSNLYTNSSIYEEIFKALPDENSVSDQASTKLASIRKEQRKLEESIKDKLNHFIHSSTYSKYLQEAVITLRNNRYVIPVKSEYRTMIKGFVHDVSSSGSTIFIEPMVIFELNNQLNIIKSEEVIEIEKILANLSSLFYCYTNELKKDIKIIGKLDFIFSKARYAILLDGICPILNENKEITLLGARHPFIDKDKVVPIDITLGKDYRSLVITGPNTGGKTVTLKTVGLLTLMACSGLFIPAKPSSSLYVFDSIYANIGDEQSIAESLSTFSSHMSNIIEILKYSTSESLVLLDELGSGTDPVEGSSLAISILETLFNKGMLTISSTHYPELKKYCFTTQGFENASCSFDLENLKPTYQLLVGVPGQSNAFAISRKLGLENEILDRAKSFLASDHISMEELLKSIYDDKLTIEKEKENIQKNSSQIELLRKSLEQKENTLQDKNNSMIEKAKQDARKILMDAKKEASSMIQEMNRIYENTSSSSIKNLNQIRNKLNDSIKDTATTSAKNAQIIPNIDEEDLQIGKIVHIHSLSQDGFLLSLPNKSKEVQVQIGNVKMMIPISQIARIKEPANTKKSSGSSSYKTNKTKTATSEINVIGHNTEEAIFVIDKFLDDSALSKLQTVRIVHGKGTGILRKAIAKYLKTNSHVKDFRLGVYGEGETGVTVVTLK